ncbi:MAG: hypothetical protein Q9159_007635 [Coniocarpon cinnabarinum]
MVTYTTVNRSKPHGHDIQIWADEGMVKERTSVEPGAALEGREDPKSRAYMASITAASNALADVNKDNKDISVAVIEYERVPVPLSSALCVMSWRVSINYDQKKVTVKFGRASRFQHKVFRESSGHPSKTIDLPQQH